MKATVDELDADDRHPFVHGDIRDKELVDGLVPAHDVSVNVAAEGHEYGRSKLPVSRRPSASFPTPFGLPDPPPLVDSSPVVVAGRFTARRAVT